MHSWTLPAGYDWWALAALLDDALPYRAALPRCRAVSTQHRAHTEDANSGSHTVQRGLRPHTRTVRWYVSTTCPCGMVDSPATATPLLTRHPDPRLGPYTARRPARVHHHPRGTRRRRRTRRVERRIGRRVPRLARCLRPARHHAPEDPPLPAADELHARSLPTDPGRRLGLRPARRVHRQRNAALPD